ncbi:MAG: hypothetical protein ABIJ08_04385 [Nanoarchaeota archaeon]
MKKQIIFGILLIVMFTVGCQKEVTNFEDCAAAGNPVMESYPRQCRSGDITYTEIIDEEIMPENPIGGQRDEYGCLGPAGYSWNEDINACVREWELDEDQREAAKIAVMPMSYRPITIVGVEAVKCPGCFDVKIANGDNKQTTIPIRDWKVSYDQPASELTSELCENSGGIWDECGSRCSIDNQGKEGVACTLQCEQLCECGGIAGFSCPTGYKCKIPEGIADAMGYCV